ATMMHSFPIATLVGIFWFPVGYSLPFTPGNAFIGGLGRVFLSGMQKAAAAQMLTVSPNAPTVPEPVFLFFRMSFAIISTAIIT
ncbi:ammonia channel protein, partial [Neisseria meningitidis]